MHLKLVTLSHYSKSKNDQELLHSYSSPASLQFAQEKLAGSHFEFLFVKLELISNLWCSIEVSFREHCLIIIVAIEAYSKVDSKSFNTSTYLLDFKVTVIAALIDSVH